MEVRNLSGSGGYVGKEWCKKVTIGGTSYLVDGKMDPDDADYPGYSAKKLFVLTSVDRDGSTAQAVQITDRGFIESVEKKLGHSGREKLRSRGFSIP